MIVVKIELWPLGIARRAREIGRMYIANEGTGTSSKGDYLAAVCRRGKPDVPREMFTEREQRRYPQAGTAPKATRTGRVDGFPRLSYNVWRLIARALLACFPEERPK